MRRNRFAESDAQIEKRKERTGNLDLVKIDEIFDEMEAYENSSHFGIIFANGQNLIMLATIGFAGFISTV